MKAKLAVPMFIILFSSFYGIAQNEPIRLIPEFGKQTIYEFTELTYILSDDNEKQHRFIKKKTYELKFDKFGPENKEVLKVNITKNTLEKPDQPTPEVKDYRFPYFQEAFPDNTSPDFTETLLSRLTLEYSFDFETSNIELLNLEELLMEARKILREKGLSPGKIDNRIVDFNKKIIPATTSQIQQIFQIPQASFSGSLNIKNFDIHLSLEKPWAHLTQKKWEKEPGLYSKEIIYEAEKRFLKKYNTVEIDSLKYPVLFENKKYDLKYTENDISLKVSKTIPQNRFTISGKIENLRNKKITLAVLRSPSGTQLFEESVFLDENNSFQIETELNHPQLVYLQFGNINLVDELPMMAFYAEPGSRIHFEAMGETFPWEVTFSEDFAGASKLLHDWRKEYNIFNQRLDWSTINYFYSDMNYADFNKAFYIILSEKRNNIEKHIFDYIKNETKAYLLNLLIFYVSMKKSYAIYPSGRFGFEEIGEEDFLKMKNFLDTVNIYSFYNEYGIHSRQLAGSYLNYFFSKKNRNVNNTQISDFTASLIMSPYAFYNDLPHQVEMAKSILAGHALYSVLTELLLREKSDISNQPNQFESYTQQKADEYLNLMTRVCNDREFINSIKEIIDNQQKWEDENFVPANKFFNENAEPVYMSDFFGKNPSIFYITNDWAAERYFWDDLAKENPEINFVLVMEGSNIQEWLDYEKRAEPVAHQLFLINEDVKLRDIFKSNSRHFILYDKNGVRIGFAGNAVTARDIAKKSLHAPSKQLNKSQLKIIVIVLLIFLTLLILSLLIWRWR
ncbi:hypothetical protein, partial [Maribellus maritimus]|uniref:hypothetical protein n=1 Tax=Maribellus maritimus TaxID=2870838 RepID=UPI001EEB4213